MVLLGFVWVIHAGGFWPGDSQSWYIVHGFLQYCIVCDQIWDNHFSGNHCSPIYRTLVVKILPLRENDNAQRLNYYDPLYTINNTNRPQTVVARYSCWVQMHHDCSLAILPPHHVWWDFVSHVNWKIIIIYKYIYLTYDEICCQIILLK